MARETVGVVCRDLVPGRGLPGQVDGLVMLVFVANRLLGHVGHVTPNGGVFCEIQPGYVLVDAVVAEPCEEPQLVLFDRTPEGRIDAPE